MATPIKKIKMRKSTYDSNGVLLPEGSEFDIGTEEGQVSEEDAKIIIKAKKAKKVA